MDFKGNVAIVTGGAQGMGLAFCLKLLEKGMKVCMCDIRDEPEDFERISTIYKDCVIFRKCDVTSSNSLKDAFDKTLQSFGKIDLVINNAGILNEKDWRKSIEVNFIAVVNGVKLGLEYMGKDKGGAGGYIVNIGSNMAFDTFPLAPVYGATKHAVIGLTKNYGTDYHFEKTGVKVASVCPGPVETPLFYATPDYTLDAEEGRKLIASVETVKPEVIAEGLIKLLTDGRNGAILRVQAEFRTYV